jgi:hypothetical protein
MVQITYFFMMFFRDVQCALHNDRNTERLFAHFKGVGEIQKFAFQGKSDNLNYASLTSLKVTGFNGVCIKMYCFSPFVYI